MNHTRTSRTRTSRTRTSRTRTSRTRSGLPRGGRRSPVRSLPALAVLAAQAGSLVAFGAPAAASLAAETTGLGGHESRAAATPVSLLMYEEVVRITTSPEGEADLGYTEVTSSTGPSGRALASWLWPGPLVGDGLGLVTAGAGLPPTSYPVQSSSTFPSGGSENGDLGPGLRQRATSSADELSALTLVRPVDEGAAESGGTRAAGPTVPSPGDLDATGDATGDMVVAEEPSDEAAPDSPLLDVNGMRSLSHVAHGGAKVVTEATSAVSEVVLLGGLVTADSVTSTVSSSTTGKDAAATGRTRVVGLEIAGTPVRVDGKGVTVADRTAGPEGEADLAATMETLGLSVRRSPVERDVRKATGSAVASGLWVEVDTTVLRRALDSGQLDALVGGLPPEVSSQLAPALRLSPRLVIRLGHAESTSAGALAGILPAGGDEAPTADPAAGAPKDGVVGGAPAGPSGGTAAGAAGGSVPTTPAGSSSAGTVPETSAPVALASGPGLPPLYSVPGLLLFTGIALAGGLGWWLQRVGGSVLGGAGTCAHGHLRGVPNLRKVG